MAIRMLEMNMNLNKKISLFVIILIIQITKSQAQCSWEYNRTNGMKCQLKILESQGLDLQVAELADQLDIQCSEMFLFESELPTNVFVRLQKLSELSIESCKILKIQPNAFEGLISLKRLTINTRNSIWGPGKSLEVFSSSMNGLRELQVLDMGDNNLRQLPEGVWCSMNNLQILNLTHNRIRSADNLGFSEKQCSGGGGAELKVLDVSFNELRSIPENWGVSRLRRLQHLNLQHNNITSISADSLSGLTSLRVLNLSYNHLETLPAAIFASAKELREIHLQHNELYDLPRGLFHRLEQLVVLDLSGNQLTSHHVDNTTFSGLIRLIVLNLGNNALTRIGAKTFKELYFLQILDLRNNSIGHVEEGAFLPLYNLHTLNLAENRLHTLDNRLFDGLFILSKLTLNNNLINIVENQAFRNCTDLKELDLSSNQLSEVPEAIKDLTILKSLDLGENQISEIKNGTFRNLNQLTGLRLIDNRIGNITKEMFWDLPRLSVLNLAKNRVHAIERGSFDRNTEIEAIRLDMNFLTDINGIFATLASLLWLNLSENHLVWFDYAFVPANLKWLDIHGNFIEALGNYYKLQEEIRIKTLDASHNRIVEIGPMSVPNTIELLFINNNLISAINSNTFVDKTSLARVDLYANELSKLQLHALRIAPVLHDKQVPEFYLGGNRFECDCSMEWLQRINNSTTRQHPRIMDLANIECLMPHSRNAPIRQLTSLSNKDFLCKYQTHCFAACHCCDFDACDCEMTCPTNCSCYNDQSWGTNIVDCGRQDSNRIPSKIPMDVTDLYLDGNHLPVLRSRFLVGRRNLKSLYLNASNVVTIENQTFAGLGMLQVLHLENNKIQSLAGQEFEHLPLLRELYLHNNLLTHIGNMTLTSLVSLEVLRIDNNRLFTIPVWQLQNIQYRSGLRMLTLGRNSWSCQCKFLQDLTKFITENSMIIRDADDLYCVDGDVKRDFNLNVSAICDGAIGTTGANAAGKDTSGGYIPLLAAVLVLIFLIIILIVVFVFRESVRMWLFAHYGVRVCESRFEDAGKLYDAILLHSAKDYEFVCRSIAAELEHGRPPFRLCIQQRDLPPDASHLQILEASRASRKIILVLTRHLLQTEWMRSEFRSAFHEALRGLTTKLVIIEETDVGPEAEEVNELLPYLKTIPSNRILTSDRYFWEKLRYAIPIELSPRGNNYTLDHHERFKQPVSPGVIFRQAPPPPAYYQEGEEINYSSATTATPSPRPPRHTSNDIPLRPPSEHIYSSIDSEYSAYDQENMSMVPSGAPCSPQQKLQLHKQQQLQQSHGSGHPSKWRHLRAQPQVQTTAINSSSVSATGSSSSSTAATTATTIPGGVGGSAGNSGSGGGGGNTNTNNSNTTNTSSGQAFLV